MNIPSAPPAADESQVGDPQLPRRATPAVNTRTAAGTPATRAGHCDCCTTAYAAGTPITWDRVVSGWVLVTHRSAGSRYAPRYHGVTALL